jgi:phage/plasmid-associated DNA primase
LLWALDGLDRITQQSFTVPKSSNDAILALQDLVSPVAAFVRDECDLGPQNQIATGGGLSQSGGRSIFTLHSNSVSVAVLLDRPY